MKYLRTLVALTMLAVTFALIMITTTSMTESFAQNETLMPGNQSSSAINDTSISNETESGNISGVFARGLA